MLTKLHRVQVRYLPVDRARLSRPSRAGGGSDPDTGAAIIANRATLSGTTSSTPDSATPVGRPRHRARRAHSTASSGLDGGGVVRLGSKRHRGDCHLCHIDCAASNPDQVTGSRRQQIEQQSHAGPFAGPKPESMMVPGGARRSDLKAHPSRLEQVRRFLPSWSCEFDSRHPLHSTIPSHHALSTAPDPKMIRRLRALGSLWAVQVHGHRR
jgi:hypothetical protein